MKKVERFLIGVRSFVIGIGIALILVRLITVMLLPNTQYNSEGFGNAYVVNHLDGTSKVVYSFAGNKMHLLGDNAGERGKSYWSIFASDITEDATLVAASDEYAAFKTDDGIIAIETTPTVSEDGKYSYYRKVKYEELSWFQKEKMHDVIETELRFNIPDAVIETA